MTWISVNDKLPTESGPYLVAIRELSNEDDCYEENKYVLEAWYNPMQSNIFRTEIGWSLLNEFYEYSNQIRDKITHWMPIPDPPNYDD